MALAGAEDSHGEENLPYRKSQIYNSRRVHCLTGGNQRQAPDGVGGVHEHGDPVLQLGRT
jgi:hypothetical protein